MIAMQEEQQEFIPSEAVKYLRERHGIIVTVPALRMRRSRGTSAASRVYKRMSIWTKAELDRLAANATYRTKRVQEDS
jgi:hypothetical protein